MTQAKPSPRRRARKSDGTYKGDIPGTKANEAWVAEDISTEVKEKEVDVTVVQEVETSSQKYAPKEKVRPTFGKVSTTSY